MLLQERDYDLYRHGEIEEKKESQQLAEQCGPAMSAGSKSSPSVSFNNGLRRSEFDLTSFNSLATSCSDSGSCSSSSTRRSSTLRYRGQQSLSSLSSQERIYPNFREGAATQALLQLAEVSSLQEVREEPVVTDQSLDKSQLVEGDAVMLDFSGVNRHHDKYASIIQYVLEGILLRCFIIPILNFTIRMERFVRNLPNGLLCNQVFPPSTYLLSSSISCQEKPTDFDGMDSDELGDNEDTCCYSSSSSSSSDDDNFEINHDDWGHFADFQDELADESSFIPSCSTSPLRSRSMRLSAVTTPSCAPTLETLAENQEEEDDEAREDWSF
eukprot:jgi/Psemu1/5610/gm1.5610_g